MDCDPTIMLSGPGMPPASLDDITADAERAQNWIGLKSIMVDGHSVPTLFTVDQAYATSSPFGVDAHFLVRSCADAKVSRVVAPMEVLFGALLAAQVDPALHLDASLKTVAAPVTNDTSPKALFANKAAGGGALWDAAKVLATTNADGCFSHWDMPTGELLLAATQAVRDATDHELLKCTMLIPRARMVQANLRDREDAHVSLATIVRIAFLDFRAFLVRGGLGKLLPAPSNPKAMFGSSTGKQLTSMAISPEGLLVQTKVDEGDSAAPEIVSVAQVSACLDILATIQALWHGGTIAHGQFAALSRGFRRLVTDTIGMGVYNVPSPQHDVAFDLYASALRWLWLNSEATLEDWATSAGGAYPSTQFAFLGVSWNEQKYALMSRVLHQQTLLANAKSLTNGGSARQAQAGGGKAGSKGGGNSPAQAAGAGDKASTGVFKRFTKPYDMNRTTDAMMALVQKIHPAFSGPGAYGKALRLWDANPANHVTPGVPKCWLKHAPHGGDCTSAQCLRCGTNRGRNG
jgi:hypothetical protein